MVETCRVCGQEVKVQIQKNTGYCSAKHQEAFVVAPLPIHRTEAGYPNCSTCDGGGCLDCTDPA